uniref:RING-type domain-containing protein n=1 Tax=Gouania willdenowi TaxID=441366 RepID=A0A8C5I3M9_GOUWI
METGQTVVLLNLQNLYESLYDALNQYYVTLGDQNYVDLGLGTHRVKCRVNKVFRLIVIEEKEVVYEQFPLPLINRLEKHYLDINTVLKPEQRDLVGQLQEWVGDFVSTNDQDFTTKKYNPKDVFIGCHSDTCSSVVLQVTESQEGKTDFQKTLNKAKSVLLKCATPESVVRLDKSRLLDEERDHLMNEYVTSDLHSSLGDYMICDMEQLEQSFLFTEVTTFSRLLTAADTQLLQDVTKLEVIKLLSLHQFDTQHSFLKKIRYCLTLSIAKHHCISIITFFMKYCCVNEITQCGNLNNTRTFVYFLTKLSRIEGGTSYNGFQGGLWRSVHLDDLRRSKELVIGIHSLKNMPMSDLFRDPPEGMLSSTIHMALPNIVPNFIVFKGYEDVFNTTDFLSSCVQSAVNMLRDEGDNGELTTRRVQNVLTLLNEGEPQGEFVKVVRKRLHMLLEDHESNIQRPESWVFREAFNVSGLQEGGTFMHTLWRKIQAVVTPLFANLISVIDRDSNLDLLLDGGEGIRNLWLEIFRNMGMLDVPYVVLMVQNHITKGSTMRCVMPFSWWIKDFLDELLVQTSRHKGKCILQILFVNELFVNTPLGSYLAKTESKKMKTEFFERYLQDFVSMTMNVTTDEERLILCQALTSCVDEVAKQQNDDYVCLLHIHVAHRNFQGRLQNLSRMIALQPKVVAPLLDNQHVRQCSEMVLDVHAAKACVECLDHPDLETDALCLDWLNQVKKLQASLELICSQQNSEFYGERCRERLSDVRFGLECGVCMGESQEPVALPCDHIYCLTCIKNHLHYGQKLCPKCKQLLPDNFQPCVSKTMKASCDKNVNIKRRCIGFFIDLLSSVCFKDNAPPTDGVISHLFFILLFRIFAFLLVETGDKVFTKDLSPFDELPDKNPVVRSVVLKLLLKFSFDEVQKFLQQHLKTVEDSQFLDGNKAELYALYINCLEVIIHQYICFFSPCLGCTPFFSDGKQFLSFCLDNLTAVPATVSIQHLQHIARLRLTLTKAALKQTFCSLILVLQSKDCGQMDQYLVFGESYKAVRDAVAKALVNGKNMGSPRKQTVFLLLALFREVTSLYRSPNKGLHPTTELCQALEDLIQSSKILHQVKNCATALVHNNLGPLATVPESTIIELVIHLKAVLLTDTHPLLVPLRQLGLFPEKMKVRHVNLYEVDSTRRGHILGNPEQRDNPATPDTKTMSLTPFTLVRLLTHLAMLLGASTNPQDVEQIVHPPVENINLFLGQHITKDLDQLSKALGKGTDDTVTFVHLVLKTLQELQLGSHTNIDPNLETKESRNRWEVSMATDVMTPVLKVNYFSAQYDSRVSSNFIMRATFGDDCSFLESLNQVSKVHSSAVWSCRERFSTLGLMHIIEHNDQKKDLPVLWRFLQKEREFCRIKLLPEILILQKHLVKKYQNVPEQITGSIREFIEKQRAWYEKHIKIFLETWNLLRASVTSTEMKIPEEFCSEDLNMNSPLQYILPRRQGPGLCATALVNYLVTLHNELVGAVDTHTGEDSSHYRVTMGELMEQHVISFEIDKDLLPLVLSNCQYSLERGHEVISQYDLPRIQQQIITRFLQGKPLITRTGIPTLINTQEREYETLFKTLAGNVPQHHMSPHTRSAVSGELDSFSDVCEALRIVELLLGFLSVTGGDPTLPLVSYLCDKLKMAQSIDHHILQVSALGKCSLTHCVSLWQLISALKSKKMLLLKMEPFLEYPADYQEPLTEEDKTELKRFLSRGNVDQWLLEMHEFLLLCLGRQRATEEYPPRWSVKEAVIGYMDRKDVEVPSYIEENFPENLLLSHVVDTWKYSVIAQQEIMMNR